MALLGAGDCSLNTQSLRQDAQCLPVSQRVERLHRSIALEQAASLFDESSREDCRRPLVEPVVKLLSRRIEADAQEPEAGQRVASHYFGERLTRRQANLDSPNQFGCVVGVNALGRGWIEPAKQPVQPGFPLNKRISQRPSGAQFFDGLAFPGFRCAPPVAILTPPLRGGI